MPGNTHAEECALLKLRLGRMPEESKERSAPASVPAAEAVAGAFKIDKTATTALNPSLSLPSDATVYTSMEPCSTRLSGRPSCSKRLLLASARRIVVGIAEPAKFVVCTGSRDLRAAGCEVLYECDECAVQLANEANAYHG